MFASSLCPQIPARLRYNSHKNIMSLSEDEILHNLIDSLKADRLTGPGITAHEFIPPREAAYAEMVLEPRIKKALAAQGISQFYSHQAEAVDRIRCGEHVVVMTPTASGKSIIYNIPVVETILHNPETRALYVFPLKGLEQDQLRNLNGLLDAVLGPVEKTGRKEPIRHAEVYDGDTKPYRRSRIREEMPNVIFTNPDMLHLAINPYHKKWEPFFRNLRYVVIDEVHAYRGVFGSHVSHVIRRLRRICDYWGATPLFVACSATIANPKEFTDTLTGLSFSVVDTTGAPRSGRHFICLSPHDSPYSAATRIFTQCINAGLRTIVFTKARKVTELIYKWAVQRAPLLADRISPYRAGFLPLERREIEQKLFNGELAGVISTSALELGVDIGGLDVCILCGYPGSIASMWQRAGRVGRGDRESLVVMIALKDALDHYLVSHPEMLFSKPHESASCDPANERILKQHLVCAANERWLTIDDPVYSGYIGEPVFDELIAERSLVAGKRGDLWFSGIKSPQNTVGIRSVGKSLRVRDEGGNIIGELDGRRIYRDAFPGAIYLHRGRQYRVSRLDLEDNTAYCREVNVDYYTQALSNEHAEIVDIAARFPSLLSRDVQIMYGTVRITYQVVGYDKKHLFQGTRLERTAVEMPEYVFETEGIWMAISRGLADEVVERGFDLAGTLHAAEHVMINSIPLFALCDKGDIGGISYPLYPELKSPAIFIYDGYDGGIGLTKRVLDVPREWIAAAIGILKACDCDDGCPSCVQDAQCGSGNTPLDKNGAIFFLESLLAF